jgi:hypothetical protein
MEMATWYAWLAVRPVRAGVGVVGVLVVGVEVTVVVDPPTAPLVVEAADFLVVLVEPEELFDVLEVFDVAVLAAVLFDFTCCLNGSRCLPVSRA